MMAVETAGSKISQLTAEDLKRELQARNVPHVGPKVILVKRLKKALVDEGENPETFLFNLQEKEIPAASNSKDSSNKKNVPNTPTKKPLSPAKKNVKETKKVTAAPKASPPTKKALVVLSPKKLTNESKMKAKSTVIKKEAVKLEKVKGEDLSHDKIKEEFEDQQDYEKDEDDYIMDYKTDDPKQTIKTEFHEDQHDYEMDDTDSVISEKSNFPVKSGVSKNVSTKDEPNEDMLENEYGDMMSDQDDDVIEFNGTELDFSISSSVNDKTSKTKVTNEKEAKKDSSEKSEKVKTSKKTTGNTVTLKGSETKLSSPEKGGNNKGKIEQKSLWVSGLSNSTKAADLKEAFSKHAKVASAKIVTNAKVPGAQCFGLVTVNSLEDAKACIKALNVTELVGRFITVKLMSKPAEKKPVKKSPTKPKEALPKKTKAEPVPKNDSKEKAKREAEKRENEKKEAERREAERKEAEKIRLEKERRAEKEKLKQERLRQYLKEKELREAEKRAKLEEERQRETEKRHRMEVAKFEREREKLRIERENIERERAELLRFENYRLEREKEELKKQQMKLDEARRMKRCMPPVSPDDYENRKRATIDTRQYEPPTSNYDSYSNPGMFNPKLVGSGKGSVSTHGPPPSQRMDEDKAFPPKEKKKSSRERELSEKTSSEREFLYKHYQMMKKKTRDVSEREFLYKHHQEMKKVGLARLEKMKRHLKRELRESQEEEKKYIPKSEGERKEGMRQDRRDYSPMEPKERYHEGSSSYRWENDYPHKMKMTPPRSPPLRERYDYPKKYESYESHGSSSAPNSWNSSKPPYNTKGEEHNWPQSDMRKQDSTPWSRPPQPNSDGSWWPGNNSGSPVRGGVRGAGGGRGMVRTLVPFRRQPSGQQHLPSTKPIPTIYNNQKPPFYNQGRKY